jgi:hypothetical protein
MPISYRLTSFGSPTLTGGIDQIGISLRYRRLARQKDAWLRPPLTAPGDWVGDNN